MSAPMVIMVVLIAVTLLIDVLIAAMLRAEQVRTRFKVAVRDELNMAFPLGAAVAASGVLLALATHSMDLVALLVFGVIEVPDWGPLHHVRQFGGGNGVNSILSAVVGFYFGSRS